MLVFASFRVSPSRVMTSRVQSRASAACPRLKITSRVAEGSCTPPPSQKPDVKLSPHPALRRRCPQPGCDPLRQLHPFVGGEREGDSTGCTQVRSEERRVGKECRSRW